MRFLNLIATVFNACSSLSKISKYHLYSYIFFIFLLPAQVNAYTVVKQNGFAQRANAQFFGPDIRGNPTTPVSGPSLPIENFQYISPNSISTGLPNSGLFADGTGLSYEANMSGPVIFSDNIPRPFKADALAAVSARNGYISTKATGTSISRVSQTQASVWQSDYAAASGFANAQMINSFGFQVERQTAQQLASNPLDFTLTLNVNAGFSPNSLNDFSFQPQTVTGSSKLNVDLFIINMGLNPTSVTTTADGRPVIEKISYSYLFDENSPTQQTFTINQSLNRLFELWTSGMGSLTTVDGDTSMKGRSCIDVNNGPLIDVCLINLRTEISLETLSNAGNAEVSVEASWDANINGSKDGIRFARTTAGDWGEPLDPQLLMRPSQVLAVAEPQTFGLFAVGLGLMMATLRSRRVSKQKNVFQLTRK